MFVTMIAKKITIVEGLRGEQLKFELVIFVRSIYGARIVDRGILRSVLDDVLLNNMKLAKMQGDLSSIEGIAVQFFRDVRLRMGESDICKLVQVKLVINDDQGVIVDSTPEES